MEEKKGYPKHMTPLFNMGSYVKRDCDTCIHNETCDNQEINFEDNCEDWKNKNGG